MHLGVCFELLVIAGGIVGIGPFAGGPEAEGDVTCRSECEQGESAIESTHGSNATGFSSGSNSVAVALLAFVD